MNGSVVDVCARLPRPEACVERSSIGCRPIGRPRVKLDGTDVVALRDKNGLSWSVIAKQLGVGATTVRRAYHYAKGCGSALPDPDRIDPMKETIDGESARGLK